MQLYCRGVISEASVTSLGGTVSLPGPNDVQGLKPYGEQPCA